MPWRHRWTIGTGDEGGEFCRDYGINGGFTNHGSGPFEWLGKWNLKFYNDHTASKGYLYLRGASDKRNFRDYQRDARAIRKGTDGPQPVDAAMLARVKSIVKRNVSTVKRSPMRVAYALDDEISWGAFVIPLPWRINDDDDAYAEWLKLYYGKANAPKPKYVTPDFVLPQLDRPLAEIDLSPLLDRVTYNDSVWATFVGELVESANAVDPDTPCGFVGGQAPNMWGGYDYAKLMKKIQFIEAYDLGSAQEIVRSFNPGGAMPVVTTHFHDDQRKTAEDIWKAWYHFAHGNRGMIGWVEGWFDGKQPRPWLGEFKATLKEIGQVQGRKVAGAGWIHDGVAIYYSHASTQVSWCLDIEPHGRTWINRGGDHRLGTSHLVRKAWEYLLADTGIQYDFVPYDEVVVHGVPDGYRVLILPAAYALSDVEALRIREFCMRGGTVIADFGAGLFDQHGRGRAKGALDDLFGIEHAGSKLTKHDFFGGKLWVETNQDKGFGYGKYRDLFATVDCKLHQGFAVAERNLPTQASRQVGKGRAVYLNLSPQRYLQYRDEGTADGAMRNVFMQHVLSAGVEPWIRVTVDGRPLRDYEATYWGKDDRTWVFVVQNATIRGGASGESGAQGLLDRKMKVDVEFSAVVRGAVNERTGERLGDGDKFTVEFNSTEAVFLSFRGTPPRP